MYHAKSSAHTGSPHPNMSTIFIGRSRADELEWRHIPKSADPVYNNTPGMQVELFLGDQKSKTKGRGDKPNKTG